MTVVAVFLCILLVSWGLFTNTSNAPRDFKLQYLITALARLLIFVGLHSWWSTLMGGLAVAINLVHVALVYTPAQAHLKQPYYPVKYL